jgi:hypothetical protein
VVAKSREGGAAKAIEGADNSPTPNVPRDKLVISRNKPVTPLNKPAIPRDKPTNIFGEKRINVTS